MSGSVNKVIIVGNLGKNPEIRRFSEGGVVCNFSVATSEKWKDKATGERKERTQWHNISIFNEGLAEVAAKYLKKGSKVYVEGRLETRKWQADDGSDRYATEVVLRGYSAAMTLLDVRSDGGSDAASPSQRSAARVSVGVDDEIPF